MDRFLEFFENREANYIFPKIVIIIRWNGTVNIAFVFVTEVSLRQIQDN